MRLPWIDYRSELRRPVSLVLLVLTLVGWIVVARLAWVLSERDHDYRRQVRLLTMAETTSRTELEQLRQSGGSLNAGPDHDRAKYCSSTRAVSCCSASSTGGG